MSNTTITRNIEIKQGTTYIETRTLKVANPSYPNDRTKDTLMNLTGTEATSLCANRTGTYRNAAHDYEYAEISGSAVGMLAMGVMLINTIKLY